MKSALRHLLAATPLARVHTYAEPEAVGWAGWISVLGLTVAFITPEGRWFYGW